MENNILHKTECLIYPGVYMPLHKEEDIADELKHLNQSDTILSAVNLIEMADVLKVEIALPGLRREDFFIHAYGNIVSVSVLQNEAGHQKGEKPPLHEYKYDCFDRQIILPKHADTEFISAEYACGILRLHVPKIKNPAKSRHTLIAVY
jgi:HSP20 family protein